MNTPSAQPCLRTDLPTTTSQQSDNHHNNSVSGFKQNRLADNLERYGNADQSALPDFLRRCVAQTTWLSGALCLMLMLFVHSAQAAAAIEGMIDTTAKQGAEAQLPPESGTGALYSQHSGHFQSIPLLQTSANLDIAGIVAKVNFRQSFSNTGTDTIEGIYVFPLPENAAIRELTIRVGDRTIHGMVRQHETAEKLYKVASRNGRVAGIVKQQRPNLFSLAIANIGPGEQIEVDLEYLQTVEVSNNRYSLRIPLTLTPRYSNVQVPDVVAISPPQTHAVQAQSHTFELQALIRTSTEFSALGSNSHSLHYTHGSNGYQIRLANRASLDRDIELHWSPMAVDTPAVSVFKERVEGDDFILGLVKPPLPESDQQTAQNPWSSSLARELVMIIDTSGSMAGEPIETAIHALQNALQGLGENDYFNIIAFSDRTQQLFPGSRIASDNNLQTASDFIRRLYAEGGTEMMPALRAAVRNQQEIPQELVRQLVFITDGAVGYETSVFAEIAGIIGDSRLFTVGIGQAPNGYFMKQAAISGRGTYTFIAEPAQVGTAMQELFSKLENPVMKDLKIDWIGDAGELAVAKLRDLHAGEPLVFSARLGKATRGFKVSGSLGNERWESQVLLSSATPTSSQAGRTLPANGISTIWAREKIASLMRQINATNANPSTRTLARTIANRGEVEHSTLNRPDLPSQLLRNEVIELALAHKLVTPYTSLVAIDELVTRVADEPLVPAAVPNLIPAGTQLIKINLPQGATGIDGLWLLSGSCFFLALLLGGLIFRIEYLSFGETA